MAGTLPNIPLAQQFDSSGRLLRGCLLSIYAANTSTPQDSFQDVGLTIKHPWPLAGDGNGRIPMFYLADGSVHVRLTDSAGVQQFDYPSMLVIGPSSGGGGGGGVDATAIFQTGDCIWLDQSGVRAGWVRDNARTIGNATSGASERANADVQALFVFLYNTYPDTICPVVGGRGANALADFNAGKQITTPNKRGYSPGGLTDMGNADSGALAGVPFTQGNATTAGSLCGEAMHVLMPPELAAHPHANSLNDPQHPHNVGVFNGAGTPGNVGIQGTAQANNTNAGSQALPASTGMTITNASAGSNVAHNNTGLRVLGTFYRKL